MATDEIATDELKYDAADLDLPSQLLPPSKTLVSIFCDPTQQNQSELKEQLKAAAEAKMRLQKAGNGLFDSHPSMILDNWLFLGNARDAYHLDMLRRLNITHVLNVTREIPNYHILSTKYAIRYAQICIDDTLNNSVFEFLEASKQFIDECNPRLQRDSNRKILVYCAAGKSRSSSVVTAYLMSSQVEMSAQEMQRMTHIRQCLRDATFVHKMKEETAFMMKSRLQNGESQLTAAQKENLVALRRSKHNQQILTLSEAYYFVKSCRDIISPNLSFCVHLKRFEELYHNGQNTLCDLPTFTDWDNDTVKIWRDAHDNYPIAYPIDLNAATAKPKCVVL